MKALVQSPVQPINQKKNKTNTPVHNTLNKFVISAVQFAARGRKALAAHWLAAAQACVRHKQPPGLRWWLPLRHTVSLLTACCTRGRWHKRRVPTSGTVSISVGGEGKGNWCKLQKPMLPAALWGGRLFSAEFATRNYGTVTITLVVSWEKSIRKPDNILSRTFYQDSPEYLILLNIKDILIKIIKFWQYN